MINDLKCTNFINLMNNINNTDLKISAFGYVVGNQNNWGIKNIIFPFNKLYFIKKGRIILEKIENQNITMTKELVEGNVYLISGGSAYNMFPCGDFEKYFFHFNVLINNYEDIFLEQNIIKELPFDNNMFSQFNFYNSNNTDILTTLKLKSLVYQTLTSMLFISEFDYMNKFKDLKIYSPSTMKVIDYINKNISAHLTVEEIAQNFNVSTKTLNNSFKSATNTTVKSYIIKKLNEKACVLLLNTTASLKEIANELGFDDQYRFSNFFKKNYNISPSNYRKSFNYNLQ